jgi:NAD(P)H-hydrate epimerase
MQAVDAAAIERLGIPRILLMDHAGLAVARAVRELASAPSTVIVCCGPGFNGGDGLSAARHLADWGYAPRVLIAAPRAKLKPEPTTFADILERLGITVQECVSTEEIPEAAEWRAASAIVDALLGVGAAGAPREPINSLIAAINRSGRPVVSADLPSGLDADEGTVARAAVKATVTVSFGAAKQGCFAGEGPAVTGRLVVDSITIPRRLLPA